MKSSKCNHTPSPKPQAPSGDHLRDLIDLQYDGLQIARRTFSPNQFERFTEDYLAGLHLPSTEALLNYGALFNAYARTVEPVVTLAVDQGFMTGWAYGSTVH